MPFETQQGGWVEACSARSGKEVNLTNGRARGMSQSDSASRITISLIENGAMTGMSYTENAVPWFRVQTANWSREDWEWFLNIDKQRNAHGCRYRVTGDDFYVFDPLLKPFVMPTWVLEEIYAKGLVPKKQEPEFISNLERRKKDQELDEVAVSKSSSKSEKERKQEEEAKVLNEVDKLINPYQDLVAASSTPKKTAKKRVVKKRGD